MDRIAAKLVGQQIKRPSWFLAVFVVITLALIPGILLLVNNVEPSLEKVLPSDIEQVQTMNDMRAQFGADMMYLLVYAEPPVYDVREPRMLDYIDILSQRLRTRGTILEVTNMADLARQENSGILPESYNGAKEALAASMFTSQYANEDYTFSVIRIRTDTGASAQRISEVVNDINEDIAVVEEYNPGARLQLTGFNAIDKATFEIIMSDFAVITLVSLVLVSAVVFVLFRSFGRGMLPMAVVMTALLWTMGLSGYIGFTITVVTMVAAAMILGLGIDFGIHVVHNYFELRKSKGQKKSLTLTMAELLRAMTGASLTTMAGFLALLFGVLPAMKTLGIILAMGILNTLIAAVFLLPVIVYIYDGGTRQ